MFDQNSDDLPELVCIGDAVYCIFDGRARYVPSMEILNQHSYIGTPRAVDGEFMKNYKSGPYLPATTFPDELKELDYNGFRQFICRYLSGIGVEFGAGPHPLLVPVQCRIKYADIFTAEDFYQNSTSVRGLETGTSFMHIDIQDSLDQMVNIPVNSLDFIAAPHVIEHVRSPLSAMFNAYERLRKGGRLVLIIPDRDRTFDRHRPITSIDHLLSDYYMASRDRDLEHYIEAFRLVERVPFNQLYERAFRSWQCQEDAHLHTFTPESFAEVASWVCENIGFSSVELHDGRLKVPSNEFYVTFTK